MKGRLTTGRRVPVLAGELVVACEQDDLEIVAHALGSCVAVVLYDPVAVVGGLLHALLPESRLDPEKAQARPTAYADAGVHVLYREILQLGARRGRLRVVLAGGATQRDPTRDRFRIGRRNALAARRALFECGLLIDGEDVGGHVPRTIRLAMCSGRVIVSTAGTPTELLGPSRLATQRRKHD